MTTAEIPAPEAQRGAPWQRWLLTAIAATVLLLLYTQLQPIAELLTYDVFRLGRGTHLGATVEFFVFEVPKVLLLLTGVVFAVGILRSFVTPERGRTRCRS